MDFSQAWETLTQMGNDAIARIPQLILAIVVFIIFYFVAKGIRTLVAHLSEQRRRAKNLGLVLGRLAQGGIIIGGLLVALIIIFPSFKPGDLIQLLGISSVAIGFAFRDILQNFLAGILLLLTEPFKIGDQIVFNNFEGTVEDIQTRATTIKTYDGRRIVIPNGNLFTNAVTVNTAFDKRRLEYDVGIGYGDDIEQAKTLILQAVKKIEGVLTDPAPDVLVVALADFSVNLRVRWWIEPPRRKDALELQDQVLSAIKKTLNENSIDLPFPTRQILFHDQTEETDGNRSRQREGWPAGKADVPRPRSIGSAIRKLAPGATGQSQNGKQNL
jgi:small-conductance mechanosensitive channel